MNLRRLIGAMVIVQFAVSPLAGAGDLGRTLNNCIENDPLYKDIFECPNTNVKDAVEVQYNKDNRKGHCANLKDEAFRDRIQKMMENVSTEGDVPCKLKVKPDGTDRVAEKLVKDARPIETAAENETHVVSDDTKTPERETTYTRDNAGDDNTPRKGGGLGDLFNKDFFSSLLGGGIGGFAGGLLAGIMNRNNNPYAAGVMPFGNQFGQAPWWQQPNRGLVPGFSPLGYRPGMNGIGAGGGMMTPWGYMQPVGSTGINNGFSNIYNYGGLSGGANSGLFPNINGGLSGVPSGFSPSGAGGIQGNIFNGGGIPAILPMAP